MSVTKAEIGIFAFVGVAIIVFVLFIGGTMLFKSKMNSMSSSERVTQPEPGVSCLVVTTSDGVGVSCWKDK